MSFKFKYILITVISLFLGFSFALVLFKTKSILSIVKSIDIASLAFWFSIILGALFSALVTIIATYLTVKKQEITKLKAKVIERNIDIVYQLIQLSKILSTMTLQENIKKDDLEFDYSCDHADEWPISIPTVLTEEFRSSDWYVNFIMLMDTTTRIMNIEIIHYEHFIKEYFFNLHLLFDKLPQDKKWQMAFVLKPDFREICSEFTLLLEDYLQNDIYKMRKREKIWDIKKEHAYREKLKNTNMAKYKTEFEGLLN